jgi:uncharacterized protein (TIGR02466 family)
MSIIQPLFPTPIIVSELPREFTEEEKKFFSEPDDGFYFNAGNFVSNDSYILEKPQLAEIKKYCQDALQEYFDEIIKPSTDCKPRITQSWLNHTREGGFHHLHNHPHSFLSGVLYINTAEGDSIRFVNQFEDLINLTPKITNRYNSRDHWVKVKDCSLVIFPSWIKHAVDIIKHESRISLAFNSFIEGTFGDSYGLGELTL